MIHELIVHKKENQMIIIKNHFEGKDTVIYGDVVSNGCQTFNIVDLDKICKRFDVPERIKQEVIKLHRENLEVEDTTLNVLKILKSEKSHTLNRAVASGTKNHNLLEEMLLFLDYDTETGMIIANRSDLPNHLIEKLAYDSDISIREVIASRDDLSDTLIKKLSQDKDSTVRAILASNSIIDSDLIKKLAEDKDSVVRSAIADLANIDDDIIQTLSNDFHSSVRKSIANRNNLNDAIVQKLSDD